MPSNVYCAAGNATVNLSGMDTIMHARIIRTTLAMAGVLVLAAGCGGGGGGESATDGSGDAGSGSTSDSGPLSVIQSDQYSLSLIGADAGEALGLFDDVGFQVDITVSQEGSQALASGDGDIAISSPNRFIGAIEQGLEAKIVGPTTDLWSQYAIVGNNVDADTFEDWKGGKIGITSFGSAGHYSAIKIAEALGWDESDYEIVTVGNIDALKAALRSGTIDGFAWSAQQAFLLEDEGSGRVLGAVGDLIGPMATDVIAVSDKALEERPDDIRAFCDVFYKASEQFKDDADLTAQNYEKWGVDISRRVLEAQLPIISTSSKITDEMFENMAESTRLTIDGSQVTAAQVKDMYVDCSTL